jgi:biotin operon repressor
MTDIVVNIQTHFAGLRDNGYYIFQTSGKNYDYERISHDWDPALSSHEPMIS